MAGAYAVLGSRTLYRGGLPDALATKAKDSGLGTRSLRDPARFAFTAFATLTALGRDSVAHRVSSYRQAVALTCRSPPCGRQLSQRCRDRKSVVSGKSVSVRGDLGGCRIIK